VVTRAKEIVRKLTPIGVWVFVICFGLISVDQDNSGLLSVYVGIASIALAGIMFLVWKD